MRNFIGLIGDFKYSQLLYGAGVLAVLAVFAGIIAPFSSSANTSPCIVVLGSGSKTVEVTGSAKISAPSCGITVNSANSPAVSAVGSASVSAKAICAPGGGQTSGSGKISPQANTSCSAVPDPFALAPKPIVGACTFTNLSYTNSSSYTLSPGVYCGTTNLGGSTKITLSPGIYIIKNGTLQVGGSAQVTGNGVAIFLSGNGSSVSVGGSGKLSVTAPSSGILSGFAFYFDPAAQPTAASTVTGSAQLTINGATYLPSQLLSIEGSGKILSSTLTTFVVGKIKVTGSASLSAAGTIPTIASDTQAPVIAAHADIFATGTESGAPVTYSNPAATDNIDASVTVFCSPASGTIFALGSTTVTCSAQDAAGNQAIPTTFQIGVSVPDTEAPVIAPHEDITVQGTQSGATVTYTNPTATDNKDTVVDVTCAPASDTIFIVGSTTVTCTAQDATGNQATSTTFEVGVFLPPPTPFVMNSQPDESFLCTPDWENCFTGGLGQVEIPLGAGSGLGAGSLLSVTIAKDENSPFVSQPWIIQLACYTDSSYTTTCPDWVQPNSWNGFRSYFVTESSTSSTDGKHWTAYFTNPSREANADLSSPVVFKPAYYYKLIINDNGYNIGAYGSPTLQLPYYVITGMTI